MSEPFLSRWARLKRGQGDKSGQPGGAASPGDGAGGERSCNAPGVADSAPAAAASGADPALVGSSRPESPVGRLPVPADRPAGDSAEPGVFAGATPDGPGSPRGDEASGHGTLADGTRRDRQASEPELPSLDTLTPQSDFRPFLRTGVAPATRNAALKTLFSDPHFNVMDGLDVYIEDYNQTEPIPDGMMRRLVQARTLRLFDESPESDPAGDSSTAAAHPERGGPAAPGVAAAEVGAPEGVAAEDGNTVAAEAADATAATGSDAAAAEGSDAAAVERADAAAANPSDDPSASDPGATPVARR